MISCIQVLRGQRAVCRTDAWLRRAISQAIRVMVLAAAIFTIASPRVALGQSVGSVSAWGDNYYGELGDGVAPYASTPVQVNSLSGVQAIASGNWHTLALKTDGTVWAWGLNSYSQLGNGTMTDSSTPVQVSGLSGVIAISAGSWHSLALKSDGTVWAWGANYFGELGNGTTTDSSTPVQVSGLSGITAIAAGSDHSLAVKNDGTVWAWGYGSYGQLGNSTTTFQQTSPVQVIGLSGVTSIAAGKNHSLARTGDGSVWAWGDNQYGQLGNDSIVSSSSTPVLSALSGVQAIAAGDDHTLAITVAGTVWAWGYNVTGQLGDGTNTNSGTPVAVSGLSGVVAVEGGYGHSLAVKSDGSAWAWGTNLRGELGSGSAIISNTPVQVNSPVGLTTVAGGYFHSVGLANDGTVWTWGDSVYGESGNGTNTSFSNTPLEVSNLSGAKAIAAGYSHTLALTIDGSVWAWGSNFYGELGGGTASGAATYAPVPVSNLSGIIAIAAGESHSLALRSNGTVWAWGGNWSGQLGNDATGDSGTPVQVTGPSQIIAIAAGGDHSLAVNADGTVWAWGANGCGELGDGTTNSSATPVQVSGLVGITIAAVAAGYTHSMALTSDGVVWAWGCNPDGELGNGTTVDSSVPVQVSGLPAVVAIAAGSSHSLALTSGGSLWAWGYNGDGELGDGTLNNSITPLQVIAISGVSGMEGGDWHTVALRSDGTVWAWGSNVDGQLGNGTLADSLLPVQVNGLTQGSAVAAGGSHTLALINAGTPFAYHFSVIPSTSAPVAGEPFSVTVSARDVTGNVVTGYAGTVHFSLSNSDAGATLPADYTFTTADNGSYTFSNVILRVAGPQTINVSDTVQTSVIGSADVSVGTPGPMPFISQPLVPGAVAPGGSGFTITVNGTGFNSGSVVLWNSSGRATTYVSSSRLTATILASDVALMGTASVSVVNPAPGGGRSNVVFLPVTTAAATLVLNTTAVYQTSNASRQAVADFNQDGKLDLAVMNAVGVAILLGNGDGTFQPAAVYSAGATGFLMTADFNGDGKPDVAAISGGVVTILLGKGDGTFQAHIDSSIDTSIPSPSWLAAGDFDRDGKLDLVVGYQGGAAVSVLLGNGDGSFQQFVNYTTAAQPNAVAVGDFNGDGNLDVATANFGGFAGNTVSILLGNGNGTFQPHVEYLADGAPLSLLAADFNGDGKLDLAVGASCGHSSPCGRPGTVALLLGNGNGTFQSPVTYSLGQFPYTITSGDFNGDGKLDLASSNLDSRTVSLLLGNGDGTFQPQSEVAVPNSASGGPVGIVAGDFNGDGRLDLATNGKTCCTYDEVKIMLVSAGAPPPTGADLALSPTTGGSYGVIVTNNGPVDATNVVLTDTLERFAYLSYTATQGTGCNFSAGVLTCNLGTIPKNGYASVTVTSTPPISGWANHLYAVSASQSDPNPTNNSMRLGPGQTSFNTQLGSNVSVVTGDGINVASVVFGSVTRAGTTSFSSIAPPAPIPAGFRSSPAMFFDVSTTAAFSGAVSLTFHFPPSMFRHSGKLRLFHLESAGWVDRTSAVNPISGTITGVTLSLSPFALLEPLDQPPLANAGAAGVHPGSSSMGASVRLDGSASSDADADALTYRWTGPFPEGGGTVTGAQPQVTLPLGSSRVSLVANDGEVDSAPVTVVVTVSDFDLLLTQQAAIVRGGEPAVFTVSVTPKFGPFEAPITLACPSLPANMTCSIVPASITPGPQGATATVTVNTARITAMAPAKRIHGGIGAAWLATFALAFGTLFVGANGKRRIWLLLALVLLLVAAQFACGGSGAKTALAPPLPTQSTTLNVTVSGASGSLTHSATATVAVQ